jgi:hypothetical protein
MGVAIDQLSEAPRSKPDTTLFCSKHLVFGKQLSDHRWCENVGEVCLAGISYSIAFQTFSPAELFFGLKYFSEPHPFRRIGTRMS